ISNRRCRSTQRPQRTRRGRRERTTEQRTTAASGAGFTPAERGGVQGGAPLAPPCSMTERDSLPRSEGGSRGCAASTPLLNDGAGFTPAERGGFKGARRSAPFVFLRSRRPPRATRLPYATLSRSPLAQ